MTIILKNSDLVSELQLKLDEINRDNGSDFATLSLINDKGYLDDEYSNNSFVSYEKPLDSINDEGLYSEDIQDKRTIQIEQFIRRLPDNYNASQEKIAEAKMLGITLKEHETIVDSFTKEIKC